MIRPEGDSVCLSLVETVDDGVREVLAKETDVKLYKYSDSGKWVRKNLVPSSYYRRKSGRSEEVWEWRGERKIICWTASLSGRRNAERMCLYGPEAVNLTISGFVGFSGEILIREGDRI